MATQYVISESLEKLVSAASTGLQLQDLAKSLDNSGKAEHDQIRNGVAGYLAFLTNEKLHDDPMDPKFAKIAPAQGVRENLDYMLKGSDKVVGVYTKFENAVTDEDVQGAKETFVGSLSEVDKFKFYMRMDRQGFKPVKPDDKASDDEKKVFTDLDSAIKRLQYAEKLEIALSQGNLAAAEQLVAENDSGASLYNLSLVRLYTPGLAQERSAVHYNNRLKLLQEEISELPKKLNESGAYALIDKAMEKDQGTKAKAFLKMYEAHKQAETEREEAA